MARFKSKCPILVNPLKALYFLVTLDNKSLTFLIFSLALPSFSKNFNYYFDIMPKGYWRKILKKEFFQVNKQEMYKALGNGPKEKW